MNKQSWAHMASTGGWIFDYRDNLFANSEGEPLIALITPMSDKLHGRIGVIEANMAMRTMFPSMYEDIIEAMTETLHEKFPNYDIEFFYGGTGTLQAKIAAEIDRFSLDFDSREYKDTVNNWEVQVQNMADDIRNGNTS